MPVEQPGRNTPRKMYERGVLFSPHFYNAVIKSGALFPGRVEVQQGNFIPGDQRIMENSQTFLIPEGRPCWISSAGRGSA